MRDEKKSCCLCGDTKKVNAIAKIDGVLKPLCYGCLNGFVQATPDHDIS